MAKYLRGDNVRVEASITDSDDTPTTPSSVTVTISNPDGGAVVTSGSATSTGTTGEYYYEHQTGSTDPVGIWTFVFTSISGVKTGRKDGYFELYS